MSTNKCVYVLEHHYPDISITSHVDSIWATRELAEQRMNTLEMVIDNDVYDDSFLGIRKIELQESYNKPKIYSFQDDSLYVSNGCSCCDSTWLPCWNSEDTLVGLGSAHSEEECYAQALITEEILSYTGEAYEFSLEELEQMAEESNVIVLIEEPQFDQPSGDAEDGY